MQTNRFKSIQLLFSVNIKIVKQQKKKTMACLSTNHVKCFFTLQIKGRCMRIQYECQSPNLRTSYREKARSVLGV
jgi:hypothetical protein